MKKKRIFPKNEVHWHQLRAQNVSSTESAALFNASPYMGIFELWHRKKEGLIVEIEENERMTWGKRLERTIAQGIAKDNGWSIRRMSEYYINPIIRMGSSFDYAIGKEGILEIKNVDSLAFKQGWILDEEGNLEAPAHIEIQVQHQLGLTGKKFAVIGALVGGNTVKLIKREPNEKVISLIKNKITDFWETIDKNIEPEFTSLSDAEFALSLYDDCLEGQKKDCRGDLKLTDLATRYKNIQENIKHFEEEKTIIKARIMEIVGENEKVIGDNFSISAGIVASSMVNYERKSYRNFKLNWKGEQ